jgi:hypothetical protein
MATEQADMRDTVRQENEASEHVAHVSWGQRDHLKLSTRFVTAAEQADIWHTVCGANEVSKYVAHVLSGHRGQ